MSKSHKPAPTTRNGRPVAAPAVPDRLTASHIKARVSAGLRGLDAEQLQVVELVIAAIRRGAR